MKFLMNILLVIVVGSLSVIQQGFTATKKATANNQTMYLDVNDVSYLIPIVDRSLYPQIELETHLKLNNEIFEQVLSFENPKDGINNLPYIDSKFLKKQKFWKLTSFRVDPCGEVFNVQKNKVKSLTQDRLLVSRKEGCQPRLRFVIQPFNFSGNPVATAIHLLYRIDSLELAEVAKELVSIKKFAQDELGVSTSGQPLSLHPSFVVGAKKDKGRILEKKLTHYCPVRSIA